MQVADLNLPSVTSLLRMGRFKHPQVTSWPTHSCLATLEVQSGKTSSSRTIAVLRATNHMLQIQTSIPWVLTTTIRSDNSPNHPPNPSYVSFHCSPVLLKRKPSDPNPASIEANSHAMYLASSAAGHSPQLSSHCTHRHSWYHSPYSSPTGSWYYNRIAGACRWRNLWMQRRSSQESRRSGRRLAIRWSVCMFKG